MRHKLIKEISGALKAIGPGAFEDFCLDFLPLFNPLYKGLERHGTTPEGKTRKGTPDLIKTSEDGNQIVVQCSAQANYWRIPKNRNKYPRWKPCEDIDKCLPFLINVQEIVLCSNQEVPTNAANAKAEILSYAKEKSEIKITLLCCTDIETVLINNVENPDFKVLFKNHFPKIYEWITFLKEAQGNKLAIELLREKPTSLDNVVRIATEATDSVINFKDAKDYALKKIDEIKSRFERECLPQPGNIVRHIPSGYPLIKPVGTIQTLLGVPKIGKTSLVAQCANNWKTANVNIHWFDCPVGKVESELLVKDISREIWAFFLPADKASELANGIVSAQSIHLDGLKYNLGYPTVYVLKVVGFVKTNFFKI